MSRRSDARRSARRTILRSTASLLTGTWRGRVLLMGLAVLMAAMVVNIVVATDATALALGVAVVLSLAASAPMHLHAMSLLRADAREQSAQTTTKE